jgi:hypothetical protein
MDVSGGVYHVFRDYDGTYNGDAGQSLNINPRRLLRKRTFSSSRQNWAKVTGASSSACFFRLARNSLFKIEFRVRSSTPIHRAVFGRPIFPGVQPLRFQLQFSHRWLALCHFLGLPLRRLGSGP